MRVTVLVTCTIAVAVYTAVRCRCGRRLFDVPGTPFVEVRTLENERERGGIGPVIKCRCDALCEVIEHRKAA
jgi:hypothetical protein